MQRPATQKHLSGEEIYILDDDVAVCQLLKNILSSVGYKVTSFTDFMAFLYAMRVNVPSCVILDVIMPGKSGLDILDQLRGSNVRTPVFMMSGRGNIAIAVDAMKKGARDFFEKPFVNDQIISSVRKAIDGFEGGGLHDQTHLNADKVGTPGRYASLNPALTFRECAVLDEIINGSSNKDVGEKLGISRRTVEFHRANVMAKLGARNTADLIRMTINYRD